MWKTFTAVVPHHRTTLPSWSLLFQRMSNSTAATFISGSRQALIEERLTNAFAPIAHLEVQNTSHGRKEDESHFKVVVVSEAFSATKSLVGRHRAINKAVSESDGQLAFHSLEISAAKTPEEWGRNSSVRPSPKCKGGDGLKKGKG